jgi:hypothetical protein
MENMRATEVFNDVNVKIIAIETVVCSHGKTQSSCRLYAKIEAIAVIVCSPHGVYALDMNSREIVLDQLKHDVPELGAILASFDHT